MNDPNARTSRAVDIAAENEVPITVTETIVLHANEARTLRRPWQSVQEVQNSLQITGEHELMGIVEGPIYDDTQPRSEDSDTKTYYIYQAKSYDQLPTTSKRRDPDKDPPGGLKPGTVTIIDAENLLEFRKVNFDTRKPYSHENVVDSIQTTLVPPRSRLSETAPDSEPGKLFEVAVGTGGEVSVKTIQQIGIKLTRIYEEPSREVVAGAPPRPEIPGMVNREDTWRFLGEWLLTREGAGHYPPTEHEEHIVQMQARGKEGNAYYRHWFYDGAGRIKVSSIGQTALGHRVHTEFNLGAAYIESAKPENHITPERYSEFRDGLLKSGYGLAIFGERILHLANNTDRLMDYIKIAARGKANWSHLRQSRKSDQAGIFNYIVDTVLILGRNKYDFDYDKTSYGGATQNIHAGGTKERTSDDALRDWLRLEQAYPLDIRTKGRDIVLAIMRGFEHESRNDNDWTRDNQEVMNYISQAARSSRRNFSGRQFMSADALKAFGGLVDSPEAARQAHLDLVPAMTMHEVKAIRRENLRDLRSQVKKFNDPWKNRYPV